MTFAAAYLLIEENKKRKITWRIIANSRGWWIAVLMAWTGLWFVPLTPNWDGPTFLFALCLTIVAVVLRIVAYPKEHKKAAKPSRK